MSEAPIKVNIKCNAMPFKNFMRRTLLQMWKLVGWRRFFMFDWWKVKLGCFK